MSSATRAATPYHPTTPGRVPLRPVSRAWRALRLALGLLALAAVGRQLAVHVGLGYSVVNFFSYFTNLANLFAAGVLVAGSRPAEHPSAAARRTTVRGAALRGAALRGAAVTYMTVVGIVFAVLLRHVDLGSLRPWVNTVLHTVMPVAVGIEWIARPPSAALDRRQVLTWLAFPLVYLVYVLARGAAVGWYPYPFLAPATAGGYRGVATYVLGIVVVFAASGGAVTAVGNARRRSADGARAR